MKASNKKGFTLVELLAVIVVLAIILAIAIPGIAGVIKSSTKGAFESDAKLVLNTIRYKLLEDDNFNPTTVDETSITTDLKLSNSNYEDIVIKKVSNEYKIVIIGKGKWAGLIAYGTERNMHVVDAANYDVIPPVITIVGNNPTTINVGDTYNDEGATATDETDGDLTIAIEVTSNVNPSIAGIYTVTYSVSDSTDNTGEAVRTVTVVGTPPAAPGAFIGPVSSVERNVSTAVSWNETASWGAPTTGSNYRLEVQYNSDAWNLVSNTGTTASGTHTVSSDTNYTTLKYRVRAENDQGVSDWVYSETLNILPWVTQNVASAVYHSVYNYNGTWVAVGSSNTIATSTDGTTWTAQTVGEGYTYLSVYCYNGTWVAVGWSGMVSTSTDGINWTTQLVGDSNHYAVYNQGGRWISVSVGKIATSTDGITWSIQTVGAGIYRAVYYYMSRWIAVGDSGMISTSTTGTSWSTQNVGTTRYMSVYCYGGRWIAVGEDGKIAMSTNGTSWSTQTVGGAYQSVYNYNGTWVAVGYNGLISTSTNGTGWTNQNVSAKAYYSVYYYNGTWVAVGESGTIATSTDGTTWSYVNIPSIASYQYYYSAYNYSDRWMIVGNKITTGILN